MFKVNVNLSFDGNAEEAFKFYQSVFGGELQGPMRWSENPQCEDFTEADKKKVMHVQLPVGDGNTLMGADYVAFGPDKYEKGNNFTIALQPDNLAECKKLFDGLSEGGQVIMPLGPMFWGAVFGCFKDKFGIGWMIESEKAYEEWPKED